MPQQACRRPWTRETWRQRGASTSAPLAERQPLRPTGPPLGPAWFRTMSPRACETPLFRLRGAMASSCGRVFPTMRHGTPSRSHTIPWARRCAKAEKVGDVMPRPSLVAGWEGQPVYGVRLTAVGRAGRARDPRPEAPRAPCAGAALRWTRGCGTVPSSA